MDLENLIYERKSCREYSDEEITEEEFAKIEDFIKNAKRLDSSIEFVYDILTRDRVTVRTRWSAPYYLILYSQKRDHYMENLGFVFQQLCLYMQSMGIGSCWVGMAQPKSKKENFVIAIAFGKSDDITRDFSQFNRKEISKFCDYEDGRLKPAYYAPSAINSQPWYFRHADDGFDVFQVKHNVLKRRIFGRWNPIDIGICLAHLYIANPLSFDFKIKSDCEDIDGYTYNCSVAI